MTQLEFFKTFGAAILDTIADEQVAMRVLNRAWIRHRRQFRQQAA